jgi:hypothetical protein
LLLQPQDEPVAFQPRRAVAKFSRFCLFYQEKNREILRMARRSLLRALVETMMLGRFPGFEDLWSRRKKPGAGWPAGRTHGQWVLVL